jgi:hypothetical protein
MASAMFDEAWVSCWTTAPDTNEIDEKEELPKAGPSQSIAESMFDDAFEDLKHGRDPRAPANSTTDARERLGTAALRSGDTHVPGVADRSLRRWKSQVNGHEGFHQQGRPLDIDEEAMKWAENEVRSARELGVPLTPELGGPLYDVFTEAIKRTSTRRTDSTRTKKAATKPGKRRSSFYAFRQKFHVIAGQVKPEVRWTAEHDVRNFVTYAAFLLAILQPYPNSDWTMLPRLIAGFDSSYVTFEHYAPPMVVEPNAPNPGKPFERPGTVLRPFRIGANVAMVAAGFIAPVVLVLADKDLGKEEVHILEIPGLSPYPGGSGYVLVAQRRSNPAATAASLRIVLKFFQQRTKEIVPREGTPGGEESGVLWTDGANDILQAMLGHLMVSKKDLDGMDWSDLQVPGSDTDDEPAIYTVDDFDWEETEEIVDEFAKLRIVFAKTAGGCSGRQAACDCGACFKCLHAQVKNPRQGDVLDEAVMAAARRAIDACPAVSQWKSRILHVVARVYPVLASVFSKHNVQRSFEIPGVYPLDPLIVLSQCEGFENMPESLRDHLLSIISTAADWCREHTDQPFLPEPVLTELGVPVSAVQRKKEETGKVRGAYYALNSGRAGRVTRESCHSWTAKNYQQYMGELLERANRKRKREAAAASREKKKQQQHAISDARAFSRKHPMQAGSRCNMCRTLESACLQEGADWHVCPHCDAAWCMGCVSPAMLRMHIRGCKLENCDPEPVRAPKAKVKTNLQRRRTRHSAKKPKVHSDSSSDDVPLSKVTERKLRPRTSATQPQYREKPESETESSSAANPRAEITESDADDGVKAVKILKEAWGPVPGKRVKPEEEYTQRYYRVLLSNNKKEDILAQDDYDGLKNPAESADVNPFYARVVREWRKQNPMPAIPTRIVKKANK